MAMLGLKWRKITKSSLGRVARVAGVSPMEVKGLKRFSYTSKLPRKVSNVSGYETRGFYMGPPLEGKELSSIWINRTGGGGVDDVLRHEIGHHVWGRMSPAQRRDANKILNRGSRHKPSVRSVQGQEDFAEAYERNRGSRLLSGYKNRRQKERDAVAYALKALRRKR